MNFAERRATALAILTNGQGLSRQAGSFLGQLCVDQNPLTDKQQDWWGKLVERYEQSQQGAH